MDSKRTLAAAAIITLLLPGLLGASVAGTTSDAASTLPYVKYTVLLGNGTVFNGNYVPKSNLVASQGEAGIAYDNSTGDLYVTNLLQNISVISSSKLSLKKTLHVGGEPFDVIYDSMNGNIYASNLNQKLSIIDGKTLRISGNISTGVFSSRMAINGNADTIYLLNLLNLTYEKINLSKGKLSGNVSIGLYNGTYRHPVPGIAYDPQNNTVFASNFENGTVVVLDATTGKILRNITFPAQVGDLFYESGTDAVYAAVPLVQQVYAINAATYGIEGNMTTGAYPSSISASYAGNYLFVTNELAGTLSVYNLTTFRALETLNLSSGPTGACYVSEKGYLYVVDSGKGTLSAIYVNQAASKPHPPNSFYVFYVIVPVVIAAAVFTAIIYRRKSG
ncbi:hypothetical protein IX51_02850 [uncultured archaeon]|nr:hypothetical protein IX51_02850 [uncultured archaeon]